MFKFLIPLLFVSTMAWGADKIGGSVLELHPKLDAGEPSEVVVEKERDVESEPVVKSCVPRADVSPTVINHFKEFNKPLPEQFCEGHQAPEPVEESAPSLPSEELDDVVPEDEEQFEETVPEEPPADGGGTPPGLEQDLEPEPEPRYEEAPPIIQEAVEPPVFRNRRERRYMRRLERGIEIHFPRFQLRFGW